MKKQKSHPSEKFRKGIYILPNLFTTLNLFFGYMSIITTIKGNYFAAAQFLFIAAVFDNLDGKVARATNTTSQFGIEYDSLADLISFGMAPGILVYMWVLQPMGRLGWLAAFLYTACGALRLARFNTQAGSDAGDTFQGLPIPAGAGICAATVLFCENYQFTQHVSTYLFLAMMYTVSFLMVSSVRYQSFKKPELFKKMSFNMLVFLILIVSFIAAVPCAAFFVLAVTYVVSGPIALLPFFRKADKVSNISSL